ncbi:helix-turn-helix domain-containing protein [Nocardioides mesophilus]|uniref:GAF domain-containing protein n=1 Tax=Nocardioides mesophilus TaxID=433659 RepID=A0A7G9RG39_9ACTN|nr:GAF domain-containing protein [Nocardioides mesophilus]QNN54564.1 GAF domain-containing protein [Nocardioides mesophilus]
MTAAEHADLQRWLAATAAIASAVNRPTALPALLDLVARTASELMGYDFCGVLLPDAHGRCLLIEGSFGLSTDYVRQVNERNPVTLRPSAQEPQAPSGRAYHSREPVRIADTFADEDFLPWGGVAREQGYRSMISVPLLSSGEAVGTLNCYRRQPHEYGAREVELLEMLADQAGVAITTARLRDREAATIADLRSSNASLEEQQELHRQGTRVHEQLTTVALRGGGVAGVARALADLLDRSVSVTDEPGGEPLATIGVHGPDGDGDIDVVEAPVRLGSVEVARIRVRGADRPLAPVEQRALEQAVTVCALELLRERTALEAEWRVSGEVVTDLLTGSASALQTVGERAARLGHDLDRPHAVLVLAGRTGEPATDHLLSVARGYAATATPRGLVTGLGTQVVLLWPATDPEEPRRHADRLRRLLLRARPDASVSVAVSPTCSARAEYPAAYRRARGAVELARLRGTDGVVTLDRLGVHGLLLQLEDVSQLAAFADSRLRPLRAHDEARGSALEATVRAYLHHDLSTAATAAALFVHPNTVGLRLRRAEELLGCSLTSVRALVELQVALSASEVLEAQTPSLR